MLPSNHASNFVLTKNNTPKPVKQIVDVLVAARRRGFQLNIIYNEKTVIFVVKPHAAPLEWTYEMPDRTGYHYKLPAPENLPVAVTQIINCLDAARRRGFRVTLQRQSRQFQYCINHQKNPQQWKCTLPEIDGFRDKVVLQ